MEVTDTTSLEISDPSQVNEARRQIVGFASKFGLNANIQDRLALISTELSTNLLKHTPRGGSILYQGLSNSKRIGIELFSLDDGSGMDLNKCMVDGFSSTGTLGTGLGSVKRLSDQFDSYSARGEGSIIHSRIWDEGIGENADRNFAGIAVPKQGEAQSGDKWSIVERPDFIYCLLVDGLGHGFEAAEASQQALKRFKENLLLGPAALMKVLHTSLRGTRGAVAALARINRKTMCVDYCGLGNIAGIIQSGVDRKHLVSLNGTVGYEARKFMEFSVPWTPDSVLVMHTDGLSSKTFSSISEIESKSAPLIAGWLFQQHSKSSIDDATVLVFKKCTSEQR